MLVAVDLGECSAAACRWALERAAGLKAQSVIVHHVLDASDDGGLGDLERATREVRRFVEAQKPPEGLELVYSVVRGRPADQILQAAAAHKVDAIVTGTRGRTGLDRLLLGSVAESVVRGAPCTVIVVKP